MVPLVRLPESMAEDPVMAPPTARALLRVAVPDTDMLPETVVEFMAVRGADTVRLSYKIVLANTTSPAFNVTFPVGSKATAVKFWLPLPPFVPFVACYMATLQP